MNLRLRSVDEETEARRRSGVLERAIVETTLALRNEPPPEGSAERLLSRSFGRAETILVVAEAEGSDEPSGVCFAAPLEDPLGGALPLVVALWVEPDLRHRGVARALVAEAGRLLAGRGQKALLLQAGHTDDALISMGERWGFVRDRSLMVLELP